MKRFDFEEERIKREIQKLGAKRVLVQLPEGLKPKGPYLAKIIEKTGALPIISADPCYGACDLAAAEAKSLEADLLIHYGHSRLMKYENVATVYLEARATIDVGDTVKKALPILKKWSKIGMATSVQHLQTLDDAKKILERAGKKVVIGDVKRLNYPGQVIGCDYSNVKSIADDVEAFLFIGGGQFHGLGVALSTSKPTIIAEPYEKRVYSVDKAASRILKQRWANIEEAKKAKIFAVFVGLKQGQNRFNEGLKIKEKLEKTGKTVYLLAVREITPEVVMEFPSIEAYVNTACPRISLDDTLCFKKPILTINETRVVLGETTWKELCRKGWLEN